MALLSVEHFVALNMAEIAHIAYVSKGEVVIEASLASPVSDSLLDLLGRGVLVLGRAAFLITIFRVFFTCCLNFL